VSRDFTMCNGQMKAVENPQYACVDEHALSYSITKEYAATGKQVSQ